MSGKVFCSSDQELKGASDVQNGLDSGRHHCNGSPAELGEVRADVQSCQKSTFQIFIQGSEPAPPTPVCLLSSPSLWTPPMPPVTNTGMPARWAAIMVADTVVPPERRCGMTAECWSPGLGEVTGFGFKARERVSHFAEHVGQIAAGHLHGGPALSQVVQLL